MRQQRALATLHALDNRASMLFQLTSPNPPHAASRQLNTSVAQHRSNGIARGHRPTCSLTDRVDDEKDEKKVAVVSATHRGELAFPALSRTRSTEHLRDSLMRHTPTF
jgi:hypothetical protein